MTPPDCRHTSPKIQANAYPCSLASTPGLTMPRTGSPSDVTLKCRQLYGDLVAVIHSGVFVQTRLYLLWRWAPQIDLKGHPKLQAILGWPDKPGSHSYHYSYWSPQTVSLHKENPIVWRIYKCNWATFFLPRKTSCQNTKSIRCVPIQQYCEKGFNVFRLNIGQDGTNYTYSLVPQCWERWRSCWSIMDPTQNIMLGESRAIFWNSCNCGFEVSSNVTFMAGVL